MSASDQQTQSQQQPQQQQEEFFEAVGKHAQAVDDQEEGQQLQSELEAQANPVQEIESLCMDCQETGSTRLLLTSIPFFKEVVLTSFYCPHCGNKNTSIQSASEVSPMGSVYTLKCVTRSDLNRQLVKGEHAEVFLPEVELTIPPNTRGQLTTVEGIISAVVEDLAAAQPFRRAQSQEVYEKIEALLNKLRGIVQISPESTKPEDPLSLPFTLRIDDPTGNSFAEPYGGLSDPKWSKREYQRSKQQEVQLGLAEDTGLTADYETENPEEVLSFPGVCGSCGATLETFMKKIDIPHFKEVMLMSSACHTCGYRDSEIKSGGAIAEKARKIVLKVEDGEDLKRDILKSETSSLHIPEVGLELQPGTLGGRFTTLEGLLTQVYEELDSRAFARGDSSQVNPALVGKESTIDSFLLSLKRAMSAELEGGFTVILDDPLANSYIQNLYAPDPDPGLVIDEYSRSFEQDEELGLNDIQVEGYEGEEEARQARLMHDAQSLGTTTA